MILILDDVLKSRECSALKHLFLCNGNDHEKFDGNNTTVFNYYYGSVAKIDSILDKVVEGAKILKSDCELDWCQIVLWSEGNAHQFHFDQTEERTILTSITNLNVEYLGGRTHFFDDIILEPKVGRTVYFNGNDYLHGVTPLEFGTRLTLVAWYKNELNN